MNKTEARIIIYLSQVDTRMRYAMKISTKLRIAYSYVLQILYNLEEKKWVKAKQFNVKKYYFLTRKAPLKEAKEALK